MDESNHDTIAEDDEKERRRKPTFASGPVVKAETATERGTYGSIDP